jgi:predicted DNA-binding transcriptional regulator YafY
MNRIDRVSAILIHLQSRRVVRASDIAERFNISLRTVYRDIKTLEEAGIPLIGEAGVGYSIMDGYKLPPIMFTREEAISFLTAEKFIENLTDISTANNYKSALYKIKAILKATEKTQLEEMQNSIAVLKPIKQPKLNDKDHLQILLYGISKKLVLTIDYFANHNQQNTKRNIEPIGIFFKDNNWHLIAFCRLRNDYRDFRVDRIDNLYITDIVFNNEHPTLLNYLNKAAVEKKLDLAVILVEREIYAHLGNQKYYNGFVSEKSMDSKVEMTFLIESMEGFARWFIVFGDNAEIILPETLKNRVESIVSNIYKKNFQIPFH